MFVIGLSFQQTFLLCLWVISLLVHKLVDAASALLWRWFVESLIAHFSSPSDLPSVDGGCVYFLTGGSEDWENTDSRSPLGTLIPTLPDGLVEERVWPMLAQYPELLPRLCCVNRRWRSFVGDTLEWGALTFIVHDTPQLHDPAPGDSGGSISARLWESEVANYRFLLSEDLEEIEARVRYSGFVVRAVPFYVSIEGLPPDAEECPCFYDL